MNRKLPFGVSDILPDKCYNKNYIERALCDTFFSYGYDRIETATLENCDYAAMDDSVLKKLFKFSDRDGELLALRFDPTMQIIAIAAKCEQSRLYYSLNSFEYFSDVSSSRTREFSQCGVELICDSGKDGDVEIINLAIDALEKAGLDDFILEIGHVGYFEGLMESCGLSLAQSDEIRSYMNSKDSVGLELFLQNAGVSDEFIKKLSDLITLFGDEKVLDRALQLCDCDKCKDAVERLRYIFDNCSREHLTIDLGLVRRNSYYSGIVFRAAALVPGLSILDGGRYDRLAQEFGAREAVGFSIGVQRLSDAVKQRKELPPPDIAFYSDDCKSDSLVTKHRAKGMRVVKLFDGDEKSLLAYCEARSITHLAIIRNGKVRFIKGGKF